MANHTADHWLPLHIRTAAAVLAALALLLALPGAAAGAPDPGGNENAALQLPPTGKEFGFSGLFNTTGQDSVTDAGLVANAGGTSARMPLYWSGVEQQRDVWNEPIWARHARVYADFMARGVRPHFAIMATPIWARDPGEPRQCTNINLCMYPPAREMLEEWEEFVAEVARRFPEATIEVWNEPNSLGQWRTGVDPARYAELLAAADRAATSARPDARVMMAGLGSASGPGWMPMREFLDRAYAASPSLAGHTEAINFHVYSGGRLGAGSRFAQAFADVREVRALYGDDGTPIFISETGATTTGPEGVTEAAQADVVLRTVTKILGMSDVSGVLVHTLVDRDDLPADDHERGFGVIGFSETLALAPKQAYCQLTRAAGGLHPQCPPLAVVDSGPSGPINQTSFEFSFTATEAGASFECSLDGAPFAPCLSPMRYTDLGEGPHRFEVQAIDALGRRDPEPIGREFTVDVTSPDTQLTGVSGATADVTPTFHPSTTEPGSRLQCSLDDAAWTACGDPLELSSLADGAHSLRARAIDAAGNVDPTPAARAFTVDTRAPAVTITAGPEGRTTTAQPRFEFSADEPGVSFRCAFNGNAPGPCREPAAHATLGELADGSYSFQVLAIDAASNRGATVSRSFQVDRTGPAVSIAAPASPSNDRRPQFGLESGEPGASFECRFDEAAFAPCSSPAGVDALPDGSHSIEARALDQLGNRGPIARRVFVVDTRVPDTAITSAVPAMLNQARLVVGLGADEAGSRLQCSLDDAAWTACGDPLELASLADGAHSLRARAIDAAGNVDPTPATRAFTVDTRAPAVTITAGPEGRTTTAQPRFEFSADEPGVSFRCAFNGNAPGPCREPAAHATLGELADGSYSFQVLAIDAASNRGATVSRSFQVDRTAPPAPAVSVRQREDGTLMSSSELGFQIDSSEPGVSFGCALDGGEMTACEAAPTYSGVSEGRHTFSVQVTDTAGNASAKANLRVVADHTAPRTTIKPVKRVVKPSKRLRFSSDDRHALFECSLDRGEYSDCASPYRLRPARRGRHLLRVRAVDRVGNVERTPDKLRFTAR